MRILALAVLTACLGCLEAYQTDCMCKCTSLSSTADCPCDCQAPKTVCMPGFAKVCPQKVTKCLAGEETFCPKHARAAAKHMLSALAGDAPMARLVDRSRTTSRGKVTKELKCGKGIPKFKCDFIFDYEPYGEVTAFRAARCNHRKKFSRCPVTLETREGCLILTFLANKASKVEAMGKIKLECPATTPNPTATTVTTTMPATTTLGAFSHAGENITVIGDGCSCVPEFLVSLGTDPPAGRAGGRPGGRPGAEEINWVRNRIDYEIRCKGVPKFNCTFTFETDEFCDRVQNMAARQCNHRREVKRCPVELNTKIGCKVETTVTNKGAKMLVSPKIDVSGGRQRTLGFMESCVCINSTVAAY